MLQSALEERSKSPFDFVGIHNVAKHIIHLKESSSAAYSVANRICERHGKIMIKSQDASASELMHGVEGLLQHKLSLLEGCNLRVQSMESRAQNIINLVSPIPP